MSGTGETVGVGATVAAVSVRSDPPECPPQPARATARPSSAGHSAFTPLRLRRPSTRRSVRGGRLPPATTPPAPPGDPDLPAYPRLRGAASLKPPPAPFSHRRCAPPAA